MKAFPLALSFAALLAVSPPGAGAGPFDPSFGNGGVQVGGFAPAVAGCSPAPTQWLHRLTQWQGRPAFVGKADARCVDSGAGEDYLVGRVETNYLFADGMD